MWQQQHPGLQQNGPSTPLKLDANEKEELERKKKVISISEEP